MRFTRFFLGNGDLTTGNGFAEYCILATFYKVFRGERKLDTSNDGINADFVAHGHLTLILLHMDI